MAMKVSEEGNNASDTITIAAKDIATGEADKETTAIYITVKGETGVVALAEVVATGTETEYTLTANGDYTSDQEGAVTYSESVDFTMPLDKADDNNPSDDDTDDTDSNYELVSITVNDKEITAANFVIKSVDETAGTL